MAKKSKRSSGAVAKAWVIFNKQPKAERKDLIAACEKAGINVHTAKTQYQRWLHASKTQRAVMVEKKQNGAEKTRNGMTSVAASTQP